MTMASAYAVLKFLHVLSFVFMAIPLFNLIVVNERALLGVPFQYHADRYMENIIRRGATRCFVFQGTVLATGVLMLVAGPLGITALWGNWVLLVKTVLLFTLVTLLSYVHLRLQPQIESILASVTADSTPAPDLAARLKPYRVRRKRLATVCLFLVITTIVLGMQVYGRFSAGLTVTLIAFGALFAWRANRTLLRFGWV
ncbi:MAG: hypothetical protein HY337_03840 [Gemmatimonadetes bacterium]|nr:hypothetical protein [Gemmatimonadota bacterium]